MILPKDRVALEASPAKTAESISYGATFAVLGWLLLSNYSGIGYAERENQSVAGAPPQVDTSAYVESPLDQPNSSMGTRSPAQTTDETSVAPKLAAATLAQTDLATETSQYITSPLAWHAELKPYQQFDSRIHRRAFSDLRWSNQQGTAAEPITGYIEDLVLPLPLIEPLYLFNTANASETVNSSHQASNSGGKSGLIREITVTSTEADRLAVRTARPDNTQRPQIPRPYRAQKLQRSFVLPPRIQALRP